MLVDSDCMKTIIFSFLSAVICGFASAQQMRNKSPEQIAMEEYFKQQNSPEAVQRRQQEAAQRQIEQQRRQQQWELENIKWELEQQKKQIEQARWEEQVRRNGQGR